MTKQEATQRGQQHAAAGKKLTPFDCQAFDKELFALTNRNPKGYAELRGAFNNGWQAEYLKQVGL